MRQTGKSKTCVWRWQQRFMDEGFDGLYRVPTLVMHRTDDNWVSVTGGRYIGAHIAGARYIELPGPVIRATSRCLSTPVRAMASG
jgi:hypothetical protein